MNKYTLNLININNQGIKPKYNDYFENSFYSIYENFETFIKTEKVEYYIKPYIKLKTEYKEVAKLFNLFAFNGINLQSNISNYIFCYRFSNITDGIYSLNFSINCKNESNLKINFLLTFGVDNNFNIKKIDNLSYNNQTCYRVTYSNKVMYILINRCSSVYFNKLLYGKRICKCLFDNILYIDFILNTKTNSSAKLVFFDNEQSLRKYLYVGENRFFNLFDKKFLMLDISSGNEKLDLMCENLIKYSYKDLYRAKFENDNFVFKFCNLIPFDYSLVKLLIKNNTNLDNLSLLHSYLNILLFTGEKFSDKINQLAKELLLNISKITYDKIVYLAMIYKDIIRLKNYYKLGNNLLALEEEIYNKLYAINYPLIINKIKENICLDDVLLICLCKPFLLKHVYSEFIKIIIDNGFFNNTFNDKCKYFTCLYYLYDTSNKDIIYDILLNDNSYIVEKLAIVLDKIIGLNLENKLINLSANLPNKIDKIVVNFTINKCFTTVLTKRSFDTFIVNDISFEKKKKIRLKKGYCKIITSSI